MTSKIKILWIGDGGVATGFSRVNHSIINNLPEKDYEIHHLCVNYYGDPYDHKPNHFMYPAITGGDILGLGRVEKLIDTINPDLIFILNDPWVVIKYLALIKADKRVVAYVPVDAKPMQSSWVKILSRINRLVTYTNFGKSAFTDLKPDLQNIIVIPHGVDTTTFFPMERKKARNLGNVSEDVFIVFNGNRNQPRKRVDLTIKAFAQFAKDKPDAMLYLHMGKVDAGYNIDILCERYGILDKLIKTSDNLSPQKYVSDTILNVIYNIADVGINTSMGEGWGLVSTEQAVCKVPQIVPNGSACKELFYNRGLLIDIDHTMPHVGILTEGEVISVKDAVDKLNMYYYDENLRNTYAEEAYKFFTKPEFNWYNIAKKWDQVFKEVLNEKPTAIEAIEAEKQSIEASANDNLAR